MKRVLITGANGQLGKTFKELFGEENNSIQFVYTSQDVLDITNREALNLFFESNTFSHCLNFAAYTDVEKAEELQEKAFKANATAVKFLAEQCKKNNVTLYHISTDYVFDGNKREPYTEIDATNPINIYGASKLQGEIYIQELLDKYFIIRTSWLYSAYNKNFVKFIYDEAKKGKELNILTTQKGIPTSSIELSKFIYFIINNEVNYGVYNFTSKEQTTWYDFAIYITQTLDSRISPIDNFERNAKRPEYSVLSTVKVEKVYPILKTWKEDVDVVLSKLKVFD